MNQRLFGIETEYGVGSTNVSGEGERDDYIEALLDRANESVPHLSDQFSHGMFLRNGARFYIDCGHPEFTTPECDNPWDTVRYVLAGERVLERLARECSAAGKPFFVFRTQVDYSGAGTTWGCHESYMHVGRRETLADDIIPHLVSRIVFTGAGGFDNRAAGAEFLVSPRVAHLTQEASDSSTAERGIFHTKDEPLASGDYRRLHLLCGESLCSELAMWLKVGTTALVVAMIDGGQRPGGLMQLEDSVTAMQAFARDPSCTAGVRTESGRVVTAIEIQRHYLTQAEACAQRSWMPPWTEKVCQRWRHILDELQHGPAYVADCLDWALKLSLVRNHAQRRGLAWESLPAVNGLADRLGRHERGPRSDSLRASVNRRRRAIAAGQSALPFEEPEFSEGSHTELERLIAVREELFEIDTRFGQIGEAGIFAQLDAQGLLRHHVPGVDNIEHAVSHPPANGRARVRGELVAQLASNNKHFKADWQAVWDIRERRYVDLSDPFASSADWQPLQSPNRRLRRLTEPLEALFAPRLRRRTGGGDPPGEPDLGI